MAKAKKSAPVKAKSAAKKATAKAVKTVKKAVKATKPKKPEPKAKAPARKAPVKATIKTVKKAPAKKMPAAKSNTSKLNKNTPAQKVAAHKAKAKKAVAASKASAPKIEMKKPAAAHQSMPTQKANDNFNDFSSGDYVVYPAHGVGQIEGIEIQTIAGMEIKLYAVSFEKDRMRLKIPVMKAQTSGLRKVCSGERLDDALKTLKGRARIKRMMWSRRAQEYEMKINSGDPMAIAEVLRDLKRSNDDTEQSYSERQIYQSALERLAREVAIVEKMTEDKAAEHIETLMGKKPANDKKAA